MDIELRLYGGLNRSAPDGQTCSACQVAPSETISDAVTRLGIPGTVHITVLRNGRREDMSTRLEPGDTLALLPEIDGG
jgi:molybdopterin converting factor small subunit